MLLQSMAIYGLHAVLMGSSLFLVRKWHHSGVLESMPPRHSWFLAALLGGINLLIAQPLQYLVPDFVQAYYVGGAAALSGNPDFHELFRSGVDGFVNLPVLALVFAPFALLPADVSGALFSLIGLGACMLAFRYLCEIAALNRYQSAILAVLMLTNGPLMNSLKEGNTSHFALLALAWGFLKIRKGGTLLTGVVLAVTALFKLPLLLIGIWALLRGHFRVALGGAGTLVSVVALSVVLFGMDAHRLWYESVVVASSAHPIGAFNVQSFSAAMIRGASPYALCLWEGVELDPVWRRLSSLLAMALLGMSALVCFIASKRSKANPEMGMQVEFSMVALLACTTSPLAWSHYYAWVLLPFAFLLSDRWGGLMWRGGFPGRRALIWALVVMSSLPVVFPVCKPIGPLADAYLFFMSHYLIAAVGLLFILGIRRLVPYPQAPGSKIA